MTGDEAWLLGIRAGHPDGASRVGLYVGGEEAVLSYEAADAVDFERDDVARNSWRMGYIYGYKAGAEGVALSECWEGA